MSNPGVLAITLLFVSLTICANPIDVSITHDGKTVAHHAQTKHAKASHTPIVSVDGTLEILHEDDFAGGKSLWHYHIRKADKSVAPLNIDSLPQDIKPGSKLHVHGRKGVQSNEIDPDAITVTAEPQALVAPTTVTVLAAQVYFKNIAQPGASSVPATMASVGQQYNEMSYGLETFNTTTTSWVKLPVAATSACNWSDVMSSAPAALKAANPAWDTTKYLYTVYFVSGLQGCTWLGLGYVGNPKIAFLNGTAGRQPVAHEMGHNHGLLHAGNQNKVGSGCSGQEYGDGYSSMGNNQNAGHFNIRQKQILNWLPANAIQTISAGSAAQTFTLSPVELASGSLYEVKVTTANANQTYLIEYRDHLGFDAPTVAGPVVQVRLNNPWDCAYGSDDTHLLLAAGNNGNLTSGTVFQDATNNLQITVGPLGPVPATISLTGTPSPSYSGQAVTYVAQITSQRAVTGTVSFTDGGVPLCPNAPIASGKSACTDNAPIPGTHTIIAAYSGDSSNQPATSAPYSQVVNSGPQPPPPAQFMNGGCEAPTTNGFLYNPVNVPGWTFSSGSGVQRNSSQFSAPTAPEGVQTCFLQNGGSMMQTITLTAGSYTLNFQIANRTARAVGAPNNPINVSVDGTQVGALVVPSALGWSTVSVPFTVAPSVKTVGDSHTFSLTGTVTCSGCDVTSFIDAVSVQ